VADGTTWDTWSFPLSGGRPELLQRDAAFPTQDGSRLVFVKPFTYTLAGERLLMREPDGDVVTLAQATTGIKQPTVSPDGTRVAYVDGRSIQIVDIEGGDPEEVATGTHVQWWDDTTLLVSDSALS